MLDSLIFLRKKAPANLRWKANAQRHIKTTDSNHAWKNLRLKEKRFETQPATLSPRGLLPRRLSSTNYHTSDFTTQRLFVHCKKGRR